MRAAISCEYWPPKSSTSTSSTVAGRSAERAGAEVEVGLLIQLFDRRYDLSAPVRPHADVLLALKLLALGLQSGGDHHLGAVERGNVLVAARRHRRAQRAEQVEGAVVLRGGAQED